MSDDLVKQSLAELHDIVRCRCHPAYTGRGMHDPDCECDSVEAVKAVADRIEELEAKLKTSEEIGRAFEEDAGQLRAKLEKLTKAADRVHDSYWNNTDGNIVGMFDLGKALRQAKETPHD